MNKKGFTLLEIILCIALITVIGVSTSLILVNNSKKSVLEENTDFFRNALEVYLANHSDIIYNVENNYKAVAISLETLKNEGLISDNLDINYKENYFAVSDAVLLANGENGDEACSNNITLQVFASWEIKDSSEPVYICPRVNDTSASNSLSYITNGYVAQGKNANNWVKFEVKANNDDWIYFPNDEEKDLWRIVNIDDEGYIKLIYNKPIGVNNQYQETFTGLELVRSSVIYKTLANCTDRYNCYHYARANSTGLSYMESLVPGNVKNKIKDAINNISWVISKNYLTTIFTTTNLNTAYSNDCKYNAYQNSSSSYYTDFIGNINLKEFRASFLYEETYLPSTIMGYRKNSYYKYYEIYVCDNENGAVRISTHAPDFTSKDIPYDKVAVADYAPVITLDSSVKIKSYLNCSNGKVRGSKECPYELVKE